jgi:SH3-like domain-containing protein
MGQAALKLCAARRYDRAMPLSPSRIPFITALAVLVLGFWMQAAPVRAADDGVPYWASLRVDEVNMRVGPGEDYHIVWVYRRVQLPLKVLRLKEGWRLVRDPDGAEGWMLGRFLTRKRGAIVTGTAPAEMREQPGGAGRLLWRLEPGVTGNLGDCAANWCRFETSGHAGYVPQDRLFGTGDP